MTKNTCISSSSNINIVNIVNTVNKFIIIIQIIFKTDK